MSEGYLVYVLEDDLITATLITLLLEQTQAVGQVQHYADGQRALDQLTTALRAGTALPDLLLLDLDMPQLTGWEFLDAFARLPLPHPVCVLVLTSSLSPEDRARAAEYPAGSRLFCQALNPADAGSHAPLTPSGRWPGGRREIVRWSGLAGHN